MKTIACVGILVADVMVETVERYPEKGVLEPVKAITMHNGGNAMTASINTKKLGAESYMVGMVGADMFGQFLKSRLDEAGVNTQGLKISDKAQTSASVLMIDKNAELEKVIAKRLEPLGIIGDGFKPNTRFSHYVYCEPDSEDIKTMLEASKSATGKEPIVCGSCLSDLSVISKYGSSSAYAFGIGRDFSEPGGAHQPNEYIECDKLVEYTKTIGSYILRVLG
ncbi:MAG: hypothetical protein J6D15_02280 [Clostridia bacterium]|nr:hypothetical protein [Clostridia bacterium]